MVRKSSHRPSSSAGEGPHPGELARLGATALVLVVFGIACGVGGWRVAGIALGALGIAIAAMSWLVGCSLARFALGARPSTSKPAGETPIPRAVGVLEIVFGAYGMIGAQAQKPLPTGTADAQAEAADAQVGSMLRSTSAVEERFSELLTPHQRSRIQQARAAERGLTYAWLQSAPAWVPVSVVSDDGSPLAGRTMTVDPASARWVVLTHGYAGRWHEMILYARHWACQGYNLLLVDQRAHGHSGGRWRGLGYLERRDLVAWARWLVAPEGPVGPNAHIVLHGHSMGAASVCLASAEPDLPRQVGVVVSDSSFVSGWSACAHLLGDGGLPEHPTLDLMRAALMVQPDGFDMARANVLEALGCPGPAVLLIHGAEDSLVPVATVQQLYEATVRPKGLLVVPGAGHCQACLADPVAYYGEVFSFVTQHEGEAGEKPL